MKWSLLLFAGLMFVACNDNPVTGPSSCPEGTQDVALPSGELACKVALPIVIETGFECRNFSPAWPNRFDFKTFAVCDRRPFLPRIDLDFLNGLDLHALKPSVYPSTPRSLPSSDALDLLWVIDNSGSMCEEQAQVITGVKNFVQQIVGSGVDLQLGITTTQTIDDYPFEPLARPGYLQSTPQPIPATDTACINKLDENHQPIAGDYTPVLDALKIARSCVADLQPGEFEWTSAEIECADQHTTGCQIQALGCTDHECSLEELFPDAIRYRPLPKVFKSSAYRMGSSYNYDQMAADLSCMALVGTRGYGIERGFEAVQLALAPSMIQAGGPNAGLIRENARLGILFLTDEDDCSGDVDVKGVCGESACQYAQTDDAWGKLLPVESVISSVQASVAAVKGREIDLRELLVASFHADGQYAGEVPPTSVSEQVCSTDERYQLQPSCFSQLGTAFSGFRYSQLLRALPLGNAYPFAANQAVPIEGVLCDGGLLEPLSQVASFFVDAVHTDGSH